MATEISIEDLVRDSDVSELEWAQNAAGKIVAQAPSTHVARLVYVFMQYTDPDAISLPAKELVEGGADLNPFLDARYAEDEV